MLIYLFNNPNIHSIVSSRPELSGFLISSLFFVKLIHKNQFIAVVIASISDEVYCKKSKYKLVSYFFTIT